MVAERSQKTKTQQSQQDKTGSPAKTDLVSSPLHDMVPSIIQKMERTSDTSPANLSPSDVMQLQRTFGNQNVNRLMSGQPMQTSYSLVQRDDTIKTKPEAKVDPEVSARAEKIRATRNFMGPPTQKQYDEDIKNAKWQVEVIKQVFQSKAYKDLDGAQQKMLKQLLEGVNEELSIPALKRMKQELGAKSIDLAKKSHLESFLSKKAYLPGVVDTPEGALDGNLKEVSISKPTEVKKFKFRSGEADANKYTVTVGKQSVLVYVPKNPDATAGEFHSVKEIAEGLATLPEKELEIVKDVRMHAGANPDDDYWRKEFSDPNFESYMTAGSGGTIDIYPMSTKMTDDYMKGTMIHEAGHILSKQKWGEDSAKDKGWEPWRKAMKSDPQAASQYATNNADEDFAETLVVYEQSKGKPQEEELRAMMPERFKLIDQLLAEK